MQVIIWTCVFPWDLMITSGQVYPAYVFCAQDEGFFGNQEFSARMCCVFCLWVCVLMWTGVLGHGIFSFHRPERKLQLSKCNRNGRQSFHIRGNWGELTDNIRRGNVYCLTLLKAEHLISVLQGCIFAPAPNGLA